LPRFKAFASKEIPVISAPRRKRENKHQSPGRASAETPAPFSEKTIAATADGLRLPLPVTGPAPGIDMARSRAAIAAGSCSAPVSGSGAGAMVRAGGDSLLDGMSRMAKESQ